MKLNATDSVNHKQLNFAKHVNVLPLEEETSTMLHERQQKITCYLFFKTFIAPVKLKTRKSTVYYSLIDLTSKNMKCHGR
jgi:hypothetical protein